LLDAAERAPEQDRGRLLHEAEALLMEAAPIVPLYGYVTKNLVDPRLGGFYETRSTSTRPSSGTGRATPSWRHSAPRGGAEVLAFLLRRLAWLALTVWVVLTGAFFLMHAVRGGPFDAERALAPAVEANVRARYHLDWPEWKQYLQYLGPLNLDAQAAQALGGDGTRVLGGVLAGDLGPSFQYRDLSVNDILAQSLPISITLGACGLCVALLLGLPAGILSALRRGSALDTLLQVGATVGIALPNFVIAGFLVLLFVFAVPLLPVAGWGTARQLVLPSLVLGLPFAAYVARLVRAGMLETLQQTGWRARAPRACPSAR
jgi:oligopeptide transport system permease protein